MSTSSPDAPLLARSIPGSGGAWAARWVAVAVWLLAGLVAGYWGLRWVGYGPVQTLPVAAPQSTEVDAEAVARALGVGLVPATALANGTATAPQGGRYTLKGVVAPAAGGASSTSGVALIEVEGQPARPYRVGAAVDGRWVVQEVTARTATLSPASGAAAAESLRLVLSGSPGWATAPGAGAQNQRQAP